MEAVLNPRLDEAEMARWRHQLGSDSINDSLLLWLQSQGGVRIQDRESLSKEDDGGIITSSTSRCSFVAMLSDGGDDSKEQTTSLASILCMHRRNRDASFDMFARKETRLSSIVGCEVWSRLFLFYDVDESRVQCDFISMLDSSWTHVRDGVLFKSLTVGEYDRVRRAIISALVADLCGDDPQQEFHDAMESLPSSGERSPAA